MNNREMFLNVWRKQNAITAWEETSEPVPGAEVHVSDLVQGQVVQIHADPHMRDTKPQNAVVYKILRDDTGKIETIILVPTSPYTVPATEREILLGRLVYQAWNSVTLSPEQLARLSPTSFDEIIPENDLLDLQETLLHVVIGDPLREDLVECTGLPIRHLSDPRLDYERRFAFSGRYDLREPECPRLSE